MSRLRPLSPGTTLLAVVACGTIGVCGVGMLLAALIGGLADGGELGALIGPAVPLIAVGALGLRILPRPDRRTAIRPVAGLGSITLAWSLAALIGTIPFLLAGQFHNLIDAYFEAMSGFSTTGATLIADVDAVPDALLAWRSIMQWLGGVGIVVLIVAIAPTLAPGLQRFFYAEASGIGDSRLTPRIADTAKIVGGIYAALTAAAAISFFVAGMSSFDAINQAMTTLATGGFSTHTSSIAFYDSVAVESVVIVFMAAAAINFAFYWRLVRRQRLMPQLAEVRIYIGILIVATAAVTLSLIGTGDADTAGEALRQAGFTVTSLSSTTGFTTSDFDLWGGFAEVVLITAMVIGGCAGSTAGGMKVVRVALLGKAATQELQRQTQPRAVTVLRLGGRVFDESIRGAVLAFFCIYVLIFAIGVVGFTASGLGEVSAIGGVAATLNGVGPGLGELGGLENFEALSEPARVLASFLMLVGRLEIFTVVALLVAGATALRRRL